MKNKNEKKFPIGYSKKDLIDKINEYANESIGSKNSDILIQNFTKASIGIADLQRRYARNAFIIAFVSFFLLVISLFV